MAGKKKGATSRTPSSPLVEWSRKPEFAPFGDRLDFLSPERQHLALQGRMKILPPLHPEKRKPKES